MCRYLPRQHEAVCVSQGGSLVVGGRVAVSREVGRSSKGWRDEKELQLGCRVSGLAFVCVYEASLQTAGRDQDHDERQGRSHQQLYTDAGSFRTHV